MSQALAQISTTDPAFEQECVRLFTGYLHALGLPNSVGAIYGLLFASAAPLCLADIMERLAMSKGSVSQGLALLRQCGAVKSVAMATPGDRKEYYEPELALRRLASGLIRDKIKPLAQESRGAMARMRQRSATVSGEQYEFQTDRIRQLETWHRQLGRVLPVVQMLLKVPRP